MRRTSRIVARGLLMAVVTHLGVPGDSDAQTLGEAIAQLRSGSYDEALSALREIALGDESDSGRSAAYVAYMAALAEVYRVTKPGAPLLLIEHVRAPTSIKRSILRLWAPCHKILFVGCRLNRDTEANVKDAGFQVQEVRRLALEAGLVPIILIRATNPKG